MPGTLASYCTNLRRQYFTLQIGNRVIAVLLDSEIDSENVGNPHDGGNPEQNEESTGESFAQTV